jgi:hypothetical protein
MAIVVHMRSSITRNRPYRAAEARAFIEWVLPSAPDIPIQIAHLTGGGTFDDPKVDEALGEFLRAFSPQAAWAAFRELPLSEKQFRTIAANVAPYMR